MTVAFNGVAVTLLNVADSSAAVLISEDDLDSLRETVFWLSQPGIRDDLDEAREPGRSLVGDEVRTRYGLAPL